MGGGETAFSFGDRIFVYAQGSLKCAWVEMDSTGYKFMNIE